MEDFQIKSESEIKSSVSEEPKSPKKRVLTIVIDVVICFIFAIALAITGTIVTVKATLSSNYVSGMSMFPTLNAIGRNPEGNFLDPYKQEYLLPGSKVEYLFSQENDNVLNNLKRFDIVTTYYKTDLKNPEDYQTPRKDNLKTDEKKIKRLVGMPGETIWLSTGAYGDETSCFTGKLYVSSDPRLKEYDLTHYSVSQLIDLGLNISLIEQPLKSSDYNNALRRVKGREEELYNNGSPIEYNYRWTCSSKNDGGIDEYVVLGDNRMGFYSRDSRDVTVGKISRYLLCGKVHSRVGLCPIIDSAGNTGNLDIFTFNWRSI